jgi:hypothetical protein
MEKNEEFAIATIINAFLLSSELATLLSGRYGGLMYVILVKKKHISIL